MPNSQDRRLPRSGSNRSRCPNATQNVAAVPGPGVALAVDAPEELPDWLATAGGEPAGAVEEAPRATTAEATRLTAVGHRRAWTR